MSDMVRGMPPTGGPPMSAPPVDGIMGASTDPIKKNMSFFNPTDAAAIKGSGMFDKNMKVTDFLMKIGIDPQGPISQLQQFAQNQVKNADMVGKMQGIAADTSGDMGGGSPPPGEMTGGIQDLLNQ